MGKLFIHEAPLSEKGGESTGAIIELGYPK